MAPPIISPVNVPVSSGLILKPPATSITPVSILDPWVIGRSSATLAGGSGSNRFLVGFAAGETNNPPSGATYGNQACTQFTTNDAGQNDLTVYTLNEAGIAAAENSDFVVSGQSSNHSAAAIYQNVLQSAPSPAVDVVDATATNASISTSAPANNIAGANGAVLIAGVMNNGTVPDFAFTWDSPFVEQVEDGVTAESVVLAVAHVFTSNTDVVDAVATQTGGTPRMILSVLRLNPIT